MRNEGLAGLGKTALQAGEVNDRRRFGKGMEAALCDSPTLFFIDTEMKGGLGGSKVANGLAGERARCLNGAHAGRMWAGKSGMRRCAK